MRAYPICILSSFLVGCSLLAGCGASPPPDPGIVTYSQVQQIFNKSCAGGGCHVETVDPRILGGNLDLSAAQAAPCTINIAAALDPARMLVKPGDPAASYLLCKVDRSCASISGTWMPIGETLPEEDLAILRAWIQQGAKGGEVGSCDSSPTVGGSDTTPPTFAGASGAAASAKSVQLSWSAASDNVTAQSQVVYLIYQAAAPGAENLTMPSYTTAPGATSFNVGQLADSTKYYFVVRAQDQAGNVDSNQVEVSATTPGETIPPTFAGASSAAGGSNSVMLQWAAATDNVTAQNQLVYLIYQAAAAGGESFTTPSYTTAPGATGFNVGKLAVSTKYYFVVRAQDLAGNIDTNKIEVSATTLATSDTMPPAFAGASSTTGATNAIQVQWTAATDNLTAQNQLVYLIYQAAAAGGENYATPSYTSAAGATNYTIPGLTAGTSYYFVVRAQDAAGNIDANKIEVTAKPLADTAPPTFAGLVSATASGTSIALSWSSATDNVSAASQISYLIYQASAAGGENYATPTYTTAAGATSYTVNGLTAGSTYYFVVRAKDAAGNIDTNTVQKSAMVATPSFSGQIQPIFTANCTGAACHSGAKPQQGLDLSSTAVSYSNLVNVLSSQCATTKRVLPSQPTMSYLMWKLQGTGPCFTGSQMPKGAPLSAAQINLVSSWIAAGALNN